MAGESARDMAQRQREKSERLAKSAEKWQRGAEGEEATARALEVLPAAEWTVFHDRRWPGRRLANVDHVVVGPPGVFVIDSKNWTGKVEVRDQVLRQNGYKREREVVSAAESAIAISLVTPDLSAGLAVPVLCFVREEPLTGWARDVMVCSTANVVEMLKSRPPRLDEAQRRQICVGLDLTLAQANAPGAAAPWPSRTSAQPQPRPLSAQRQPRGSKARRRTKPSATGQLLRFAIAALALLFVVSSGLLPAAGHWFGEHLTQQIAPEPTEKSKPKPKQERQNKNPAKREVGDGT
ncbi:nuclease-related domain-containing protein [Nocardioides abyssi]|uniref:Nuclease-related domain-containing protein n=1 Tax=Nocardioides abyssi TaxID=3058370 RepID=A0ABT8EPY9_9ACTN|nr:nuclease-related domain-containing protein [Nocardioides abyssi]MDN4159981.1 nuclease-related domain-containing protein [Nocardioides abyssi]